MAPDQNGHITRADRPPVKHAGSVSAGLYQAGDIGCTTLRVVQDAHVISLGRRKRALEAQSIEGDTLELLDTQAAVVRGRFVRVGAGCVIDRVEYSEDLTVEDGGIVKEPVRC